MLTAEGCRQRRQRLWQKFNPKPEVDHLLLFNPIHLIYLANFCVDPFSPGAGFPGYLRLSRDGHTTLIHDNRLPRSVEQAHVDERQVVTWYDGQNPGRGPRPLAPLEILGPPGRFRVQDWPGDPYAETLISALTTLRRQKDPDEIALLRLGMKATEAGHAWARTHIQPGMTELDIFRGVNSACIQAAGQPVMVYGDFAVSPGPERRGGPPTDRVLKTGDMFILDFSVVIHGYRSDFTNTLVVGQDPSAGQRRLFDLCLAAMTAGEKVLKAGQACLSVYQAVRGVFEMGGMAQFFPHHAGHGLGLMHPENPFLVRHADETLWEGDVVTLEPGLYVPGVGGLRIEHNYLVKAGGFERLSNHAIDLK
jgi:Xaa-Pro aminopeptidase